MFTWATDFAEYLHGLVYPQPPAGAAYGYRWQAGQGVPPALSVLDVSSGVPPGVYVVFSGQHVDPSVDFFGRYVGGPGPVYPTPGPVSAALTTLVSDVGHNPPPGEAGWTAPDPQRMLDLDGFLRYGATCLDLINQIAQGQQLLAGIAGGAYSVFVSPGMAMNQTFAANLQDSVDLVTAAVTDYERGGPVPTALLNTAIDAQYAGHGAGLPRYTQLAADMNAAPLYTLFQPAAAFTPTYLAGAFAYLGAPLDGPMLQQWLSPAGFPAFDAAVRAMTALGANAVPTLSMFLAALSVALHQVAPQGPGAGAGVKFYVQNDNDNLIGSPDFRPPAIGLAHELMHARHYVAGTSPGYDYGHFTTTLAELMFAGIGPSATDPVNENAIRAGWAGLVGVDPSNTWAVPAQRLTYELPVLPETPTSMRQRNHCL